VDTEKPLEGTASSGNLEAVRWLHEQGMTQHEVGEALVVAAGKGYVPIIRYLLQHCGANLIWYGPLALGAALEGGHLQVLCLLLEAGARTDCGFVVQAAQRCLRRFNPEQLGTIQAATQHGHTVFAKMLRGLGAAANQEGVVSVTNSTLSPLSESSTAVREAPGRVDAGLGSA
jgi:hypothetical protein